MSYALDDPPSARRAKGLDGKVLALFHFRLVVILNQADRLATMYLIG